MHFMPPYMKSAWEKCQAQHAEKLHPGLMLYRFFDPADHKKQGLQRIEKLKIAGSAQLCKRQEAQLKSLRQIGYETSHWQQTGISPVACGLGIPSTLENGFFLDQTWGLPYLPGSILKGIAQDYALMDDDALLDPVKRRSFMDCNEKFIAVFGEQVEESNAPSSRKIAPRRGHVLFSDAFPVLSDSDTPFEADIINPHHGPYHGNEGETPPGDYLPPDPSYFLRIKSGTNFSFALSARSARFDLQDKSSKNITNVDISGKDLLEQATQWLKGALVSLGAGAKTRVGYGRF